ncbi:MAG: S1 RNA-binding domain-containing protein [Candidatus Woesearchaeota archaeon]
MLYKKEGYPQESEFVLCTITKIQFNSVFARLEEYDKQGMIHISEISAGRIRNIRDFVREGKVVVCLVLRVNKERGQIDLSLRRVNEAQKRIKLNFIKQEQKAEKILEYFAKSHNEDLQQIYSAIMEKIKNDYDNLHSFFEAVVRSEASISILGLTKNQSQELEELIKQRIKLPEVEIEGNLYVSTFQPNGVDIIKNALLMLKEAGKERLSLNYIGAGKYPLKVKAEDYKTAEKILKNSVDKVLDYLGNNKADAKFERIEK